MKFILSNLKRLVLLLPLLILSLSANCQKIPSSSVSCTDSVRALTVSWYAQKLRADTLKRSLTDTTLHFRQYRRSAQVKQDSTYQVGFKKGTKEGRKYGRKQIIWFEAVLIVIGGIARVFIFNK